MRRAETVAIDEQHFGSDRKFIDSAVHGQVGCIQDIDLINLHMAGFRDSPGHCIFYNFLSKFQSLFPRQLFGVIQ